MTRRLTFPVLLLAWLLLPGLPLAPGGAELQEPPAAQVPTVAPPTVSAQTVINEVNAFYVDYWKAWDDRDTKSIEAGLDTDFVSYLYVAPQGLMQANKEASMAGVRQYFDSVRGQQTLWRRTVLTMEPRSAAEVIVAVRNEFSLMGAGGETEITIEVVRRGAEGRWRLARKWSEKKPY